MSLMFASVYATIRGMLKWFLMLFLCATHMFALDVKVKSKTAVLVNADTGAVLFDKGKDRRVAPGSITKIATALYALKHIEDFDQTVVCLPECLVRICPKVKVDHNYTHPSHWLEYDGTTYGIRKGEKLPLDSLFYGMMLVSGNDAANVIAHHVSGNVLKFMDDVNVYLKFIGCKDTHFKNPHGLHHPEHLTTAHDMARIAQEALKDPKFCQIVNTLTHKRPKTNKQNSRIITQGNRLLNKVTKFYYPKAFGMKTGYHSNAKYTLVASAKHEGRTLIAVVLGSPDDQQRYRDAINLFEAAFAEKKERRLLFRKDEMMFRHEFKKGSPPCIAGLKEDVEIEYFPAEESELRSFLRWNVISLPIQKGDRVGEIVLTDKDEDVLHIAPLLAQNTILAKHRMPKRFILALILILAIFAVYFFPKIGKLLKR